MFIHLYKISVSVAQWCSTLFVDTLNLFNIFKRYYIYLTDIKYIYIDIKYIYKHICIYYKTVWSSGPLNYIHKN